MRLRIPINATPAERQMAVPLIMLLLFVPACAIIAMRIVGDAGVWPLWMVMILLLALLVVLSVGVFRRNRAALTSAAWAYAFGCTAVIQLSYGVFVLITGRLPNKYDPAPVGRSSAATNLLFAACWSAFAYGLSRWSARRRKSI
jgi:hypothetical protein